jgi:limonene-1,2-epoxide hydrolase
MNRKNLKRSGIGATRHALKVFAAALALNGYAGMAAAQYNNNYPTRVTAPTTIPAPGRTEEKRAVDANPGAAKERVRSFLRQVMSGKYPDAVADYFGDDVKLIQANVARTATAREIRDAIQNTLAEKGRRETKLADIAADNNAVKVSWHSSGTLPDRSDSALANLIVDGDHSAVFVVDHDKIVSIQWE